MDFDKKIEMYRKKFHKVPPRSIIKNEEQLQGMRESSKINIAVLDYCLLYTYPSPRDVEESRMPSSA